MPEFDEEIGDVAWYADATVPVNIVPFDVYSCKFVSSHVALYAVVLFEEIQQVIVVFQANILNLKTVHKQEELNWPPFVMPQSRDGGRLIVPLFFQAFAEEVVSQDARLWQAITSTADLEVYPAVLVPSLEVVFFDEFVGDVRHFDPDIFRVLHQCVKVEVLEVDGSELCTLP